MKKYIAECFGSAMLVIFGCGSAVALTMAKSANVLTIALAFGLVLTALCYAIGSVSGCHVNPAVSLGFLINRKLSVKDFACYVISQFVGAILGASVLILIFNSNANLGANGFEALSTLNTNMLSAFIIEVILTLIFVLTILSVTSNEKNANISGLVIGATLTLVHIIGIPFTGTSVNPARSFGPALLVGGEALSQVWLFIVAPLVGATIAALIYKYLIKE